MVLIVTKKITKKFGIHPVSPGFQSAMVASLPNVYVAF